MRQVRWFMVGAALLAAYLVSGCASTANTEAQRLGWERWEQCKDVAHGLSLHHIAPNGDMEFAYSGMGTTGSTAFMECLQQARIRQGLPPGTRRY